MAKREIVEIDEELCDGCGECVPNCPEGAIDIIGGKARLVSDSYCDGLGACLGYCPRGAITIIEREADPFDEEAVEERQRMAQPHHHGAGVSCPSAAVKEFKPKGSEAPGGQREVSPSALGQWPVQIHLVPPNAPFLEDAHLLLAADCVPFAYAGFHRDFLAGRVLLVGCPKLDDYGAYLEKITAIVGNNRLKRVTVVRMEVPCCAGITEIARRAVLAAGSRVSLEEVVVSIRGEILERKVLIPEEKEVGAHVES